MLIFDRTKRLMEMIQDMQEFVDAIVDALDDEKEDTLLTHQTRLEITALEHAIDILKRYRSE